MNKNETVTEIESRVWTVKIVARVSLGLVWIYEGLVPKILYAGLHPEQTALVRRWGLYWRTPEFTLRALGMAQVAAGLVLLIGWAERATVAATALGMMVLMVLVAGGLPSMLTDPFGALAKDICLVACAATVWLLAPLPARRR